MFSTLFYQLVYCPLVWMPQDLTHDGSTLVQVMAWCRRVTSHYLNWCWLRFMTPHGVTRPQWVNMARSFFPSSRVYCTSEIVCLSSLRFVSVKFILNMTCCINSSSMDKMAAISQTFSNAFSRIKIFVFAFHEFQWSLLRSVQIDNKEYWFRLWLGAEQATRHLNQCRPSSPTHKRGAAEN